MLSHGDNGVIYAYDRLYSSELIWTLFTAEKCPTLAGKPKIIMFQVKFMKNLISLHTIYNSVINNFFSGPVLVIGPLRMEPPKYMEA